MQNHPMFEICPHFQSCGGCFSQDIPYRDELLLKQNKVNYLFWQHGVDHFLPSGVPFPVAGTPIGYRSRMDFCYIKNSFGQKKAKQWNARVAIHDCNIVAPAIREILKTLNRWIVDVPHNILQDMLRFATVRSAAHHENTSITFIVNETNSYVPDFKKLLEEFCKTLARNCNVMLGFIGEKSQVSFSDKLEVLRGSEILYDRLLGREIAFHSQSFFQNNVFVFEKILDYISKWIKKQFPDTSQTNLHSRPTLFDLYGGCGSFSVALCHLFSHTVLVELAGSNARVAEINAEKIKKMGYSMSVHSGNVESFDSTLDKKIGVEQKDTSRQSVVIADPPRAGLGKKGIRSVLKLQPKLFFYVSCNPLSLAKELNAFACENYEILDIALFDLFPRTTHMEAVAVLKKRCISEK